MKPSSTGRLVARAVAGATAHVYQRASRYFPAATLTADALGTVDDLWILHPHGDALPRPDDVDHATTHAGRKVLLLDGTWRQAGEMLRSVERLGRCRIHRSSTVPSASAVRVAAGKYLQARW